MSAETFVFVGEELSKYRFPDGHPVSSIDRQGAFWAEAVVRGLDKRVVIGVPRLATREELERFHTPDYVSWVKLRSEIGDGYLDDRRIRTQRFGQEHQLQQHLRRIGNDYLDDSDLGGDTPAFPGVFERGAAVSGTALEGLDRIMKGQTRRTFQPIGGHHHARPSSAAGFCVFNDLGVVIETLRTRFGVQRVGYVDIDAHHGDGIYYQYETDPELIIVDIHEDGNFLYPGTGHRYEIGRGKAQGTKLNLPLQPGDGDGEFFAACYTPAVHARIAFELRAFADERCDGKLMAFGGGGYNPDNVVAAWTNTLTALI